MTDRETAENNLRAWAATAADRDNRVRAAHAAGISKHRIHTITGLGRATIDRILGGGNDMRPISDDWQEILDTVFPVPSPKEDK